MRWTAVDAADAARAEPERHATAHRSHATPRLVQGRDHLPAARQGVLRLQRRRHRRLRGADAAARLHRRSSASTRSGCCRSIPRRCATTATTSPTTATSTRLRRRCATSSAFVDEAHRRGLRVITELVINHTSDQHPGSSGRGSAKPGSPERDFYVWSDTDQTATRARASSSSTPRSRTGPGTRWPRPYFWHRFYSHQPDLNFDNPRCSRRCSSVMRFWLDLGVDGLRLDAIPYLSSATAPTTRTCPRRTTS